MVRYNVDPESLALSSHTMCFPCHPITLPRSIGQDKLKLYHLPSGTSDTLLYILIRTFFPLKMWQTSSFSCHLVREDDGKIEAITHKLFKPNSMLSM